MNLEEKIFLIGFVLSGFLYVLLISANIPGFIGAGFAGAVMIWLFGYKLPVKIKNFKKD